MGVTLKVDYGNGAEKVFHDLPMKAVTLPPQPNDIVHVLDLLKHAEAITPSLHFAVQEQWLGGNEGSTNRAGLVPVIVTEIDGLAGDWHVTVNDQAVNLQKQMTSLGIFPSTAGAVNDGDNVCLSMMADPEGCDRA